MDQNRPKCMVKMVPDFVSAVTFSFFGIGSSSLEIFKNYVSKR